MLTLTAVEARAASARAAAAAAKPIGLLNAYSTRNLGDAAIMTAIARLSPARSAAASVDDSEPLALPGVMLRADLADCDQFVSVGGDIFNNARPRLLTRHFLANVATLARHRRNAVVFGQTIPASCRGLALDLLAGVLRRVPAVVVRDRESHRLLREKGVAAALSFDAAFALAPTEADRREAKAFLAGLGFEPPRTALLSVRPFDPLYPQDEQRFVANLARLAGMLADRGHQVGVLIQAAVGPADGDHAIARRIVEREPRARVVDLVERRPDCASPVGRLLGVMALAEIVVAVRYHAAVLRLAAGRMPYHLHYSRKGADLSRRLALPGASLDAFSPNTDLHAIEHTAAELFDPRPLAADVRDCFDAAMARLP